MTIPILSRQRCLPLSWSAPLGSVTLSLRFLLDEVCCVFGSRLRLRGEAGVVVDLATVVAGLFAWILYHTLGFSLAFCCMLCPPLCAELILMCLVECRFINLRESRRGASQLPTHA